MQAFCLIFSVYAAQLAQQPRHPRIALAQGGIEYKLLGALPPTCRDKDPREDLKTLARMYCTGLEMQMRDKAR